VAFHRALAAGVLVRPETLRKLVLEPPPAGRSPPPITANEWLGAEPGAGAVFAMTDTGYTVVVLANVSNVARPIADRLLTMIRGS
jgi:hypothetical protein